MGASDRRDPHWRLRPSTRFIQRTNGLNDIHWHLSFEALSTIVVQFEMPQLRLRSEFSMIRDEATLSRNIDVVFYLMRIALQSWADNVEQMV